ncbi:MAG TPA: FAD-dependent oxidoreductase [Sporichthyaceae bacterium]|jgi:NADPH-dependent 2,4-dienoyl-CoA reductase/sulfur reductase-like enzyme
MRLVIVGASLAGLRAAEAARKADADVEITLIGAEPHLPYDRPPLSKAYLNPEEDVEGVPDPGHFRDEAFFAESRIELRLGKPATDLTPTQVLLGGDAVNYDRLIVATGCTPRTLPGADDLSGVHTLRTLDDAVAIRAALDAGRRTVVIGAGFIGSEIAAGAHKRGVPVTVLEALPVPLVRSVGEATGRAATALHLKHGLDLRCGVAIDGLVSDGGRVTGVRLADGEVLPAELVVVGIGVRPATEWLASSGMALYEDGAIVCDETLATSLAGVWAAGDVARFPSALFDGVLMRLEHWTNAAEQGQLAARNALNPAEAKASAAVPYFWSDWYDSRIQFVGIPAAEEILVVAEEPFLALYRRGERITGALTIDRPSEIMKYRRMIGKHGSWADALAFAGVS